MCETHFVLIEHIILHIEANRFTTALDQVLLLYPVMFKILKIKKVYFFVRKTSLWLETLKEILQFLRETIHSLGKKQANLGWYVYLLFTVCNVFQWLT